MTTTKLQDAIRYAYLLIAADVADGHYPQGAVLDGFTVLHDYVDANGYLTDAVEGFGLPDDHATATAIADGVTVRLQAAPITVTVTA